MEITLKFTKRSRYCKALNHLWDHPEKYAVICYGGIYGASTNWYVEYKKL